MPTRRIYTFGFAVALIVSVGWAALAQNNREDPVDKVADAKDRAVRDLARHVATHEVHKLHWKVLEADREFTSVIDQLSDDLFAERFTYRWKVSVLWAGRWNDRGAAVDEFEKEAIATVQAGQDEVWQVGGDGVVRLASAVRAKTSCLVCHTAKANDGANKPITVNDLIGIVAVRMFPRDEDREQHAADEFKAAIENLRKVAAKYSDTKLAEPILELLNQLQKIQEAKPDEDDK